MSFPQYPKYKDSGVEWLGKVPEHWDVLPCRAIVHERTAKNDGAQCENYLSLMANVGIIPYAEKGDVGNKKPEDLSKCKIVTRGDFVINSMNYGIGSYGLSEYDGVCSPVYIVLKPQTEIIESRFAFRIFENRAFQTFAQSFGNGILEHRCAINWDILKSIGVGIPPVNEQKVILDFLDRETRKIDELVVEQRRLMELLKEKRQAVISYAVTHGLNPAASLKPSGIEWLGDIPKHWRLAPLRWFARCRSGDGLPSEEVELLESEGHAIPVIGGNGLLGYTAEGNIAHAVLAVGRVGALCGNVHVVTPPAWITDNALVLDPDPNVFDLQFLSSVLLSRNLNNIASKTAQPLITGTQVSDQRVPTPSIDEQKEIVAVLRLQTAKFNTLTAEAQRAIDLLQERRSALISAAVTGQIDVRGNLPPSCIRADTLTIKLAREVLAAEILKCCYDLPTMGRIKLQKTIHLCEYVGELEEICGDYERQKLGPFDADMMDEIASGLMANRWFREEKKESRYIYHPLEKLGEHSGYLYRWGDRLTRVRQVIDLLRAPDTPHCERYSTLYAAWNDLLIEGKSPSDAEIIREASDPERWHENKSKTPLEKWTAALQWLKANELTPRGFGSHTRQRGVSKTMTDRTGAQMDLL